jgi:penicillin-binding protein 1B
LAAQFYFGQPISELSLHQVALLVGLVKGPSFYNPWRNPERALERRNVVLANLLKMVILLNHNLIKPKKNPWVFLKIQPLA